MDKAVRAKTTAALLAVTVVAYWWLNR